MQKRKKRMLPVLCICIAFLMCGCEKSKAVQYEEAKQLISVGEYDKAVSAFTASDGYEDSGKYLIYISALQMAEKEQFDSAASTFNSLADFLDSRQLAVYCQARQYEQNQAYDQAAALYRSAEGFKDSAERLEALAPVIAKRKAAKAARDEKFQVGRTVTFGTYPQTKGGTDSTPIEWIILDRDGDNVLLLSRYGLDNQPYNAEWTDVTWENCSLRVWLNNDFLKRAFSAEEQNAICITHIINANQGYSVWDSDGGNDTQDRIFLLSFAEANKYLGVVYGDSSMEARMTPTAYASSLGAFVNDGEYKTADGGKTGLWWLRSAGTSQNFAAFIAPDGSLYSINVGYTYGCVRPALWVNIENDIY